MTENNHNSLEDSQILTDKPAGKKWPWFVAAFVMVLVVLMLQFGIHKLLGSWTSKSHHPSKDTTSAGHQKALNELPMPAREPKKSSENTPFSVKEAIEAHQKDDTMERVKMLSELRQREDLQQQQELMRQSSALLNIGTNTAGQAAAAGGVNNGFQNPNTQYLHSLNGQGVEEVSAVMLGDLRFRLLKGTVIKGVTESAIDSDLPGLIRAHVTEDIYGEQGELPLVRNGDKLLGEYRSGDIRNGQVRLYVVWTRIILQNGLSIMLDSAGSDPLGRAGMTGPVDQHFLARYGSAVLMSSISAAAALAGTNNEGGYNSEAAFRQGMSSSFSQTASRELQQSMTIQNSIRPPQGTPISILVNKDLSFEALLSQEGVNP